MLTFNCHNEKQTSSSCDKRYFLRCRTSNPLNLWLKISLPSPTPWTCCNASMENCSSVCVCLCACWGCGGPFPLAFAQLHLCQLQQGSGTFPLCRIQGQPREHSPGRARSLSLHPRHLQPAPPHSSAAYTHSRDKWEKQTPTLH